jgi:acyl-CoA thioester hydrolase
MKIEFLKPAYMDDVLTIRTAPAEVAGASLTLKQEVFRGDTLLIEALVKAAFVSGGKARRIPQALREAMRAGLPG